MERSSSISHLRIIRHLTIIVAVLISFSTAAHDQVSSPQNGKHTSEVTVAITHDSPPFYTLNGDGGSEWRLIESVLGEIGHHSSRPLYIPFRQAMDLYERGMVDAIWLGMPNQKRESENWHLSDPLLTREFVAITLAKNDLAITTPDDLNALDVGYVSCVKELLMDVQKPSTGNNAAYKICKSDTLMLLMLYENRLDVAISERSTFEYYRGKLPQSVHKEQAVTYHKIFPPVNPRLVFYDAVLRDEFNVALQRIRNNELSRTGSTEIGMKSSSQVKHK
jgi:ABC-type amino acid transport substrate-binding protein